MKKLTEFFNSRLLLKWTIEYFFVLWLILRFVFKFDMFSAHYWWKFFHATLHGFGGFTFGVIMYASIPLYIATALYVHRKQDLPFKISTVWDKIKAIFGKIFGIFKIFNILPKPVAKAPELAPAEEPEEPTTTQYDIPDDVPPELRVPYIRAKQNLSLFGAVSVFNKQQPQSKEEEQQQQAEPELMPIPTDFDIPMDDFETDSSQNDSGFPTFKDINFDLPSEIEEKTETKLENTVTKYCDKHNIEYETYKDLVATEKYLIYDHNDGDFWIMDNETWFASGKQQTSPVPDMLNLASQNDLIPVIFLESQNVMDIEGTTNMLENNGVRVIKSLDELK
ncbi:MAG: hypothetical protein J6W27_04095 [Alphaproteobacteria bacterium]|nr:hypothetical protein [Alphaproteobacteria bacterium]